MPSLPWSAPERATALTKEEAQRAYELVRSGRDAHQWSDEEKVIFVAATRFAARGLSRLDVFLYRLRSETAR